MRIVVRATPPVDLIRVKAGSVETSSIDMCSDVPAAAPPITIEKVQFMAESTEEQPWRPTPLQIERAHRSISILRSRAVPMLENPLLYSSDEGMVKLRSGPEIAIRALVLWAVVLRAEGMPQDETLALMDTAKLWEGASPDEIDFLQDDHPDSGQCERLVWRLESIWVLLWAIGSIPDLEWPSRMCDVPRIVKLLKPAESDPEFIRNVTTRGMSEIMDAQDLTMRIHWAIRDAAINHGGFLPNDFDWSQDYELAHVTNCPGVGVVQQRHKTLNWLMRFDDSDWDLVATPT
jgi:Domain of unknown function (DUF4272)